jgi:hypothetical protein
MSNALDGLGVLYLMVIGYIAFVITFSVIFASGVIYYGKKYKFPNYAIVLIIIVGIIASIFLPPIMVVIYKMFRIFRRKIILPFIDKIKLASIPKSTHIQKYKESIVVLLNDYNNQCSIEINHNPVLQNQLIYVSDKIALINNELSIIKNNIKELNTLNAEESHINLIKLQDQYNELNIQKDTLNSQLNEINNKLNNTRPNNNQFDQLKNYLNDLRNNSHLSLAEMAQIENEVSKTIPNACKVSIFAL